MGTLFCINSYKGNGLTHSGSIASRIRLRRGSEIKDHVQLHTILDLALKAYIIKSFFVAKCITTFKKPTPRETTISQKVPDYNLFGNIKRNVPALFEY